MTLTPVKIAETNATSIPIATSTPIADATWDQFVASHPHGNFLQTSQWARLKSKFGWSAERVVLTAGGYVIGGASILFRRVAGLTLAYLPKGPLTNWKDETLTHALLAKVETLCRARGAFLVKIEPELPDSLENRAMLLRYGFVPSRQTIQPRSTIHIPIGGEPDAILKQMKSKWRYNIRLAGRKGVTVRTAEVTDLDTVIELMQITGERDGFAVHGGDYYRAAYQFFTPEQGVYLLAEYEGQPLAAIVVVLSGKRAAYLWGASNNQERNRMPNHALQWAGMEWARAQGATTYDLWGIPDEIGQLAFGMSQGNEVVDAVGCGVGAASLPLKVDGMRSDGLWGVFRFKQGFGGEVARYVGAWDRPLNPVGYRIYQGGLYLRSDGRAAVRKGVQKLQQIRADTRQIPATLQPVPDPINWQNILAEMPNRHVLQSWEWGVVKAQTGWNAERYAVQFPKDRTAGAFQFLWRQPLPYLPWRIGYVPKGPLLDWSSAEDGAFVLGEIEALARQRGCVFVKIDPNVVEDAAEGVRLLKLLGMRGWRYSPDQIQFKNTAVTDLAGAAGGRISEEALLVKMKSKWRYNIRLAGRRGITVRAGGAADLTAFYKLYAETGERDGFLVRPLAYYRHTWRAFLQAQTHQENPAGGVLLLAEHEDEALPIAGVFLLRYGECTWYFYGASSERRRRDMPNYLLQWEALRWASAQGCTRYDWWGAPTEPDDPDDPMQGVWRFKQGFGAELQEHVGAWDFPVMLGMYDFLTQTLPVVRSTVRRLRGE